MYIYHNIYIYIYYTKTAAAAPWRGDTATAPRRHGATRRRAAARPPILNAVASHVTFSENEGVYMHASSDSIVFQTNVFQHQAPHD